LVSESVEKVEKWIMGQNPHFIPNHEISYRGCHQVKHYSTLSYDMPW